MREVTRTEWLALRDVVETCRAESVRIMRDARLVRSHAVERRILSEDERSRRGRSGDARRTRQID